MVTSRFTPRQLKAFVAVAEVLSFNKAGDRLSLTASAVSQLITELESAIGFRLFDRTTRSVSLSPAGREFLSSAKGVLKNIELTQVTADDIRNRAAGVVRVAAPMVLASTALPAAIKAYTADRPKVVIRIRDAAIDGLVDMVHNAEVDLAIGSDQAVTEDVVRQVLFNSPWVLWCSPNHPLVRDGDLSWAELQRHPLVVAKAADSRGPGSTSWAQLRRHPLVVAGHDHERTLALIHAESQKGKDVRVTPVDIVDNISTAFGMTAVDLAVTLAPSYVSPMARAFGLVMCPIDRPRVMRTVCLYYSSSRAASPAAEGFRDHLVSWFEGRDDPIAWGKDLSPPSN